MALIGLTESNSHATIAPLFIPYCVIRDHLKEGLYLILRAIKKNRF